MELWIFILQESYVYDPCFKFLFSYRQVNFSGLTGPIQFNEDGKRIEMELEIFNLRNNSFTKVSCM